MRCDIQKRGQARLRYDQEDAIRAPFPAGRLGWAIGGYLHLHNEPIAKCLGDGEAAKPALLVALFTIFRLGGRSGYTPMRGPVAGYVAR